MSLTKRLLLLDGTENCSSEARMSALPSKADMCRAIRDVRFGTKADIGKTRHATKDYSASRLRLAASYAKISLNITIAAYRQPVRAS